MSNYHSNNKLETSKPKPMPDNFYRHFETDCAKL